MRPKFLYGLFCDSAVGLAAAQSTVSVDLLDPAEWETPPPPNLRIVDVFADIWPNDVWYAAGIRALTLNGARLLYHDSEANTPGEQPGLVNPGLENQFTTFISQPRHRFSPARFTNCGAYPLGGYNPPAPNPTTSPQQLNVTYAATPPPSSTSPTVDGYIARLAIDISSVPSAPADLNLWGAGPIPPPDATIVLSSVPPPPPGAQSLGTLIATFDSQFFEGLNWHLWFVPEPDSLSTVGCRAIILLFRRRLS